MPIEKSKTSIKFNNGYEYPIIGLGTWKVDIPNNIKIIYVEH